jgi:hypothetical protein
MKQALTFPLKLEDFNVFPLLGLLHFLASSARHGVGSERGGA